MAIYTKKGDKGMTSLLGGSRISKSAARFEVLGGLDEANSIIGLLRSKLRKEKIKGLKTLDSELKTIQGNLLFIGSDIATPFSASPSFQKRIKRISPDLVKVLEKRIDEMEKQLPELKFFILPGGSEAASLCQLARAIVRRTERNAVRLNRNEKVNPNVLIYLNRLSDYLFVLSRDLNKLGKTKEEVWN